MSSFYYPGAFISPSQEIFLTLCTFRAQSKKPLRFCFLQSDANMLNAEHVLKYFSELQAMVFPIKCLVLSNGMHVAALSAWHPDHLSGVRDKALPDLHPLMLQCAMVQPARHRECWYYQRESCFFPEAVEEQGMIYVLHKVHLYCTVHHSAETP